MNDDIPWYGVEIPTLKRCEIVLYSMLVPSFHNVMATLFSTDTAVRTVLKSSNFPLSSVHKCWNVILFMRKFLSTPGCPKMQLFLWMIGFYFCPKALSAAPHSSRFHSRQLQPKFCTNPPSVGHRRPAVIFAYSKFSSVCWSSLSLPSPASHCKTNEQNH